VTAGGGRRGRLTDNDAWDLQPEWSPDGQRILFVRNSSSGRQEICTMKPDGSDRRVLTDTPRQRETSPDWSPDGRLIVFASGPGGDDEPDSDLYLMRADGSHRRELTRGGFADFQPAWSPNGKKIAFVRDGDLFRMNADGTRIRRVRRGATTPDWQPRP
jgi:Tol biopolymer transport system component